MWINYVVLESYLFKAQSTLAPWAQSSSLESTYESRVLSYVPPSWQATPLSLYFHRDYRRAILLTRHLASSLLRYKVRLGGLPDISHTKLVSPPLQPSHVLLQMINCGAAANSLIRGFAHVLMFSGRCWGLQQLSSANLKQYRRKLEVFSCFRLAGMKCGRRGGLVCGLLLRVDRLRLRISARFKCSGRCHASRGFHRKLLFRTGCLSAFCGRLALNQAVTRLNASLKNGPRVHA